MNTNLSARTIFLLVVYFASVVGIKLWADSVVAGTPGPDAVKQSPGGDIYIGMDNHLYRHDSDGRFLREYDMAEYGTEQLFDFLFLDDDTLLLRRGPYRPGLFAKIGAFLRLPNTRTAIAREQDHGIFRCSLDSTRCERYLSDFDSDHIHWFAYDEHSGELYLADTSRHRLHKFHEEGGELAVETAEFLFPNRIELAGGGLLVADTNHHRIKKVATDTDGFGDVIDSYPVVPEKARRAKQRWPYFFTAVGEAWWVINMKASMRDGGVYRFDAKWQYIGPVELPENADPVHLAAVGDEVLISDFTNNRIGRYALTGEFLGEFKSAALAPLLSEQKERRSRHRIISSAALAVFIASVVLGLVVGVRLEARGSDRKLPEKLETVSVDLRNPDIQWLQPNPKPTRLAVWGAAVTLLALGILTVGVISRNAATDADDPIWPLISIILSLMLLVAYRFWATGRTKIGVLDDVLILSKGTRHAAARGRNILYSGQHIVVGPIVIPLGNPSLPLFRLEDMVKYVHPILKEATVLRPGQMLWQITKRQKNETVISIIAGLTIVGLAAGW